MEDLDLKLGKAFLRPLVKVDIHKNQPVIQETLNDGRVYVSSQFVSV